MEMTEAEKQLLKEILEFWIKDYSTEEGKETHPSYVNAVSLLKKLG